MPKLNLTEEEFAEIKQKRREQELINLGYERCAARVRAILKHMDEDGMTYHEASVILQDIVK